MTPRLSIKYAYTSPFEPSFTRTHILVEGAQSIPTEIDIPSPSTRKLGFLYQRKNASVPLTACIAQWQGQSRAH